MRVIEPSELIINPDGSVFHLHIKPGQLAPNVILVGDPERVEMIASLFDTIESEASNREFISATGSFNEKKITVLSTGIGTDNIDIVMNELDALVNIDFETRTIKKEHTSLNIIRIGTSGALQANIRVDSFLASAKAIGFDGLLNFYGGRNDISDLAFEEAFKQYVGWNHLLASPYVVSCDNVLLGRIVDDNFIEGVTISAPGFYAPQGRELRLKTVDSLLNDKIEGFGYNGYKITNYEMECSAIYGLSKLLGHHALTVCIIIANRVNKTATKDYKPVMKQLISTILEKI